mgnify:CR=1 FL=1
MLWTISAAPLTAGLQSTQTFVIYCNLTILQCTSLPIGERALYLSLYRIISYISSWQELLVAFRFNISRDSTAKADSAEGVAWDPGYVHAVGESVLQGRQPDGGVSGVYTGPTPGGVLRFSGSEIVSTASVGHYKVPEKPAVQRGSSQKEDRSSPVRPEAVIDGYMGLMAASDPKEPVAW